VPNDQVHLIFNNIPLCATFGVIPYESPFFMLQDGAFNFKKQAEMGKLQGI